MSDIADQAEAIETDLIWNGMVGIIDPPRTEVRDSVTEAHRAGIRTVMITGDHPLTAARIASDLGIIVKDGKALTGDQLDQLPDEAALDKATSEVSVYARVAPEHKLKIVESLQRQGNIVAMTGDGVNDVLALKDADCGVAMAPARMPPARWPSWCCWTVTLPPCPRWWRRAAGSSTISSGPRHCTW